MIKGYQTELMDMYEKIRTDENRKLMKRREEIKNKYPNIKVANISNDKDFEKVKTELKELIGY